ncbi:MAG: hypothetical protein Q8K86_00265 [Candidatus Nanopelagicaceae bacterium]|nr:hypothetical protein [Candidatus Nanopelagicaceae bacterium]
MDVEVHQAVMGQDVHIDKSFEIREKNIRRLAELIQLERKTGKKRVCCCGDRVHVTRCTPTFDSKDDHHGDGRRNPDVLRRTTGWRRQHNSEWHIWCGCGKSVYGLTEEATWKEFMHNSHPYEWP